MLRQYLCIDLKSFYASVECVERGLDPITTNLVVADPERTDKTICLAITPAMKALGIKNRCRVFEIPKAVDYITAPPRMKKYIDYAADIYGIYLRYISKDDIHVYSIDEAFLDITHYLQLYRKSAKELAQMLMGKVFDELGICATCGIGTNLYLAKVALDITAKHSPDFIGILDEKQYQETMWDHRPLTDFWRIGHGTADQLARFGVYTMRGITETPEDVLYRCFGIDAEILIDHAWGREPTTMADIKAYRSKTNCLSSGQVLMRNYSFEEAEIIVIEMVDQLCRDMVEKAVITDSITLYVGYDNHLHTSTRGSTTVELTTNADSILVPAAVSLFRRIVNPLYPVRRINVTCNRLFPDNGTRQISFFDDTSNLERNHALQKTMLAIKHRFGKNTIIKGTSLQEAATARERNRQIGGHKSGEK